MGQFESKNISRQEFLVNSEQNHNPSGISIVELLIAIAISGLALVLLSRLLSVSLNTYNFQEQISDMNQNARFTLNELSDVIMQAGSNLQVMEADSLDRDTIIVPDGGKSKCSGFSIKFNPRGGLYQFPQKAGSPTPICTIYVEHAKDFMYTTKLQRIPNSGTSRNLKFYTLKSLDTASNFIVFTPADSFMRGDAICSFDRNRYYLNNTNLCLNTDDNVISENIDSLSIEFMDKDYKPTAQWLKIMTAKIIVCARTALPDKNYKVYADHYHHVKLQYEFRLRNKLSFN
jgi:type II secretory pathway pseudopilin PulG